MYTFVQSYIEELQGAQQSEDAMMQSERVYSINCPSSFMYQPALQTLKNKIDTLSPSAQSKVDIEFHCGNPKEYITSITDKASAGYYNGWSFVISVSRNVAIYNMHNIIYRTIQKIFNECCIT